jgi:hypothetical protein
MEHCYIKSSKLLIGALMLFVIKDGKLCIFIDYHALNKITIKKNYPLSWIDDFFDHLHGVCYFNWMDLKPDYYQIHTMNANVEKMVMRLMTSMDS